MSSLSTVRRRRQPPLPLVILLQLFTLGSSSLIADAPAQPEALAAIEAASESARAAASEADVLLALDRGWFDAAKSLLRLLRARGDAVATLADVRHRATKIRDEATEVINLMRTGANAEATAVNAVRVPCGSDHGAPILHACPSLRLTLADRSRPVARVCRRSSGLSGPSSST